MPETGKSYPGSAADRHYPTITTFTCWMRTSARYSSSFVPYFPYAVKICINGHEWVKRQLAKEGIGFGSLGQGRIVLRKPHAFTKTL